MIFIVLIRNDEECGHGIRQPPESKSEGPADSIDGTLHGEDGNRNGGVMPRLGNVSAPSTVRSLQVPKLFNIPNFILIVPNVRHRHILQTVLGLRNGETIPQKRPDIARVLVLDIVMLVPWMLHKLQVVVETSRPDVDSSVRFVILEVSSQCLIERKTQGRWLLTLYQLRQSSAQTLCLRCHASMYAFNCDVGSCRGTIL